MFLPLHAKSDYSQGYGVRSPAELVERAAALGYAALGLTDLENLYGQVEFHLACRARGLRPVTGVELRRGFRVDSPYGNRRDRLVLLARDRIGYETLCRCVTRRRTGPGPADLVPDPAEGLIILTDHSALLEQLVGKGFDPESIRALLVRPGVADSERPLLEAARRLGIRVMADLDVVLAEPGDRPLHLLQRAIHEGRPVDSLLDVSANSLPDPARARALFDDFPEAIEETEHVAAACDLDLATPARFFPQLPCAEGETSPSFLARQCRELLKRGRADGSWPGAIYDERLEQELRIIGDLGFADYFRAVAEIVGYAREHRIGVAGRGSAGGSLVARVLGITGVDPIAYGLSFERFIHPRRVDLPDIDVDLAWDRRDEVIGWAFRRFGEDRTAMVCSHQRFRRRSAIREGLKAFGVELERVDRICDRIPDEELLEARGGDRPAPVPLSLVPGRVRAALPLFDRLIGKPHHLSVHPGGLLIADRPIDRCVPLETAPKGVRVSQYDLRSVAKIGLVKIDLLGNRGLSEIDETLRLVGPDRAPGGFPDGDPATSRTLRAGDTLGCIQIESPAIRAVLSAFPVRGVKDVMAALALVRPGPGAGRAKRAFLRRANGEEPATFWHPSVRDALRDTFGLLLYEEDLMAVISRVMGIPLGEADEFRAALNRMEVDVGARQELERHFKARAREQGLAPASADRIWFQILQFVSYSFNKAHAASYADLAYRSAYLKTHFPVEFGCAVLNHHGGMYPLRTVAADLTRHGVVLRSPAVNASEIKATVRGDPHRSVLLGLGQIKRLSRSTVVGLVLERHAGGPFRDLSDLLERVDLNAGETEALILSGACDGLAPLTEANYPFVHESVVGVLRQAPRTSLEGGTPEARPLPSAGDDQVELYRRFVRVRNELRFLEMHVADHPMRLLRREAQRLGCLPIADALRIDGVDVRLAAVVSATRRRVTSSGRIQQFVTFEDETGLLEAVLLPAVYASLGDPVTTPGPFLVSGRMIRDGGQGHLRVSTVSPFHERPAPWSTVRSRPEC